MALIHVEGQDRGKILLYALSTCGWCRKTKGLLNELGVEYYYIDVDLLEGPEKVGIMREIEKWNPNHSFPTIVIDNESCVIGFNEPELKRVIGA